MKLATGLRMALLASAASAVSAVHALPQEVGPNLVTNGSFEASNSVAGSGWTISGAFTSEGFDYFIDANPADAQSGTHSFAGGAVGDPGFVSQNIPTIGGSPYRIHVWLANLSGFADGTEFLLRWGGTTLFDQTDILGFGYHEIVANALALGPSTTLSLGLRDDSFFLNVDNITVRQVPEPTTLALLLGGMGMAGVARRRRR